MFVLTERKGITLLQAEQFNATGLVRHGFSTRMGGVSPAPYDSLNLGLYNDDLLENMQENRRRFARSLDIEPTQAVCGHQVHQTNIQVVGKADGGKGYLEPATAFADTDGLITAEKGVALVTCFADCVPVMLLDPVEQVIGICHCGWRGTVNGMAVKTVEMMTNRFHCMPEHILVAIGPSISPEVYQVDSPVLEQFHQAFTFAEQCIQPVDEQHGLLDLWQANRLQLQEIGVLSAHIAVSGYCTLKQQQMFFSHRGSGGVTGRNAAMLMLIEQC